MSKDSAGPLTLGAVLVAAPRDWARFREQVVPLLVERGLYDGVLAATTLREDLGLPAHVNRHVAARQSA